MYALGFADKPQPIKKPGTFVPGFFALDCDHAATAAQRAASLRVGLETGPLSRSSVSTPPSGPSALLRTFPRFLVHTAHIRGSRSSRSGGLRRRGRRISHPVRKRAGLAHFVAPPLPSKAVSLSFAGVPRVGFADKPQPIKKPAAQGRGLHNNLA